MLVEGKWFCWPGVGCRSLAEVQELASISILAVAILFEVNAHFGFVMLVEDVFISEFVLVVGKGTLP